MSWKHFWLNGEHINSGDNHNSYCVDSYGALTGLGRRYENVWLKYEEIIGILNLKNKEEKYSLCDKLFNEKFPQLEKDIIELSKEEQSKLEKLFP